MKKVAVSFVGTKDAALYFDEVIPIAIHLDLIYDLSDNEPMGALDKITADRARDFEIAFDLLPKAVSSDKDTLECLIRINGHFLDAIKAKYINRDKKRLREVIKQNISTEVHTLFRKISNLNTEFVTHPELVSLEDEPSGQLMVSVSGLRLIDTSKASVEQIIAFREDTDSQKKSADSGRLCKKTMWENH